jgi:hypothetical protein
MIAWQYAILLALLMITRAGGVLGEGAVEAHGQGFRLAEHRATQRLARWVIAGESFEDYGSEASSPSCASRIRYSSTFCLSLSVLRNNETDFRYLCAPISHS